MASKLEVVQVLKFEGECVDELRDVYWAMIDGHVYWSDKVWIPPTLDELEENDYDPSYCCEKAIEKVEGTCWEQYIARSEVMEEEGVVLFSIEGYDGRNRWALFELSKNVGDPSLSY